MEHIVSLRASCSVVPPELQDCINARTNVLDAASQSKSGLRHSSLPLIRLLDPPNAWFNFASLDQQYR